MISLNYKVLGEKNTQRQISQDATDLIGECRERGYKPFMLVVGLTFIEVGAAHSTIEDFKVSRWDQAIDRNYFMYRTLIKERVLEILKNCESNNGLLGQEQGVNVYYSPEELYLSLVVIDPKNKSKDSEALTTADGYPYLVFRLHPHESFQDFSETEV